MKSRANTSPRVPKYGPGIEINPTYVSFLQSELDKSLATITRLREERDVLQAKLRDLKGTTFFVCPKCFQHHEPSIKAKREAVKRHVETVVEITLPVGKKQQKVI